MPPLNTQLDLAPGLLCPSDPWFLGQLYPTECWSRATLEASEIGALAVPGWPEPPHWGFFFQRPLGKLSWGFFFWR